MKIKNIRLFWKIDEKLNSSFELYQNYPNPFNPTTTIKYSISLNEKRETSKVKLIIFDILGNQVSTLVNEKQSSGNYEIQFDGNFLPSGIYFYRFQFNNFSKIKSI